jgi:5-methylcytosine-specific restriction endonuclease McrA
VSRLDFDWIGREPGPQAVWRYLDALRNDPCSYCDGPSASLDHIIATGSGGAGTWDNFTGACFRCNTTKNNASLLGFLGWRLGDAERRAKVEALQLEAHLWRTI